MAQLRSTGYKPRRARHGAKSKMSYFSPNLTVRLSVRGDRPAKFNPSIQVATVLMPALTLGRLESPGPIPHSVSDHLCVDFVNSRFTDYRGVDVVYDRLELAEWRRWFSQRCGVATERPPGPAVRRELVDLRAQLRGLLESGRPPDRRAMAALNRLLATSGHLWHLIRVKRRVELRMTWRRDDWRAVMAATIASYAQLLATDGLDRIRVCANPDCSWLFYDQTRNRSRRWCDPNMCGTLLRVRRHRVTVTTRPRTSPGV